MTTTGEPTTSTDVYARAADPRQQALWDDYLSRAPVPRGRMLEVGRGTGAVTAKVAALPGVAEAVGVDPLPYFVERARRRAPRLPRCGPRRGSGWRPARSSATSP